mmetsp:Transcript_24916/g.76932  ORF Transcript_24916/g.76932 Transcript_24916/m.76932 type:complete len:304 (+) Transcript_24916:817-1728(+)
MQLGEAAPSAPRATEAAAQAAETAAKAATARACEALHEPEQRHGAHAEEGWMAEDWRKLPGREHEAADAEHAEAAIASVAAVRAVASSVGRAVATAVRRAVRRAAASVEGVDCVAVLARSVVVVENGWRSSAAREGLVDPEQQQSPGHQSVLAHRVVREGPLDGGAQVAEVERRALTTLGEAARVEFGGFRRRRGGLVAPAEVLEARGEAAPPFRERGLDGRDRLGVRQGSGPFPELLQCGAAIGMHKVQRILLRLRARRLDRLTEVRHRLSPSFLPVRRGPSCALDLEARVAAHRRPRTRRF